MGLSEQQRSVARFLGAALFCVAVVALLWSVRPARSLPELAKSELTLVDGRLCVRGQTNPFTGVVMDTNVSGVLLSRSAVSNGLLEGISEGFYTNGQRQVTEYFQAGVAHGPRVKFHSNGRKLSEATVVDGKLHGTFKRWSEDGSLLEEIQMLEGNPHGVARSFYPSGFVKVEAHMESGKLIDQKSWKDGEYRPKEPGA